MKYSYLALDHIFKRFKLVIKKDDNDKIYQYNNNCEKAISFYLTTGYGKFNLLYNSKTMNELSKKTEEKEDIPKKEEVKLDTDKKLKKNYKNIEYNKYTEKIRINIFKAEKEVLNGKKTNILV